MEQNNSSVPIQKMLAGPVTKHHKEFTTDMIKEAISDAFCGERNPPRKTRLWTNAWGMDLFTEALVMESTGKTRLWLGYKVPRILRKLKGTIHKSVYTGRYYKDV